MRNKYKAKKATAIVNGKERVFDSTLERDRYLQLRKWQKEGLIKDLCIQVVMHLSEPFDVVKNGKKSRISARKYTADFSYTKNNMVYLEDVKGKATEAYILRRTLLLEQKRLRKVSKNSDLTDFDVFLEVYKDKEIKYI
jgi:UV DNA damage repair endonuclease